MSFTPRTYVISRGADLALGVATGALAFYLNEHNPRTAPPPGETLFELASWRISQIRSEFSRDWAERQRKNLERDLERAQAVEQREAERRS